MLEATTMQFEYEITASDYAASQVLYWKLAMGTKRFLRALYLLASGLLLVYLSQQKEAASDLVRILLLSYGVYCIVCVYITLFPRRYLLRSYRALNLSGKKYLAEINEEGFKVSGYHKAWSVCWDAIQIKGEDQQTFVFYAGDTIFMFGKNYLSTEQQVELRTLSGLK